MLEQSYRRINHGLHLDSVLRAFSLPIKCTLWKTNKTFITPTPSPPSLPKKSFRFVQYTINMYSTAPLIIKIWVKLLKITVKEFFLSKAGNHRTVNLLKKHHRCFNNFLLYFLKYLFFQNKFSWQHKDLLKWVNHYNRYIKSAL